MRPKVPGRERPEDGASEGVRTLDIHLGKVVLYQLSYARIIISFQRARKYRVRDLKLQPIS